MADGAHFVFELIDRTSQGGGTSSAPGTPGASPIASAGRPGAPVTENPATTQQRFMSTAGGASSPGEKAEERNEKKAFSERSRKIADSIADVAAGANRRIAGAAGLGGVYESAVGIAESLGASSVFGAIAPGLFTAAAIPQAIAGLVGEAAGRGRDLAKFNGELAAAKAANDVAGILRDIESANRNATGFRTAMDTTEASKRAAETVADNMRGGAGGAAQMTPERADQIADFIGLQRMGNPLVQPVGMAAEKAEEYFREFAKELRRIADLLAKSGRNDLFGWFNSQPFLTPGLGFGAAFAMGQHGNEADFNANIAIPGLMVPAGGA